MPRIVVIGGGVSGLSCAIELTRAGHAVSIWSERESKHTTSQVAAALWHPYLAEPKDRVIPWALESYRSFETWAEIPQSGVVFRQAIDLSRSQRPLPFLAKELRGVRPARKEEIPKGYQSGFVTEVPVIEMPLYLGSLHRRLRDLGVSFSLKRIESFDEALDHAAIVINCSGIGARGLCDDPSLHPIRGQITHLAGNASGRVFIDDENAPEFSYVIPRSQDTVLGGSAREDAPSMQPDPGEAEDIKRRCEAMEPALASLDKIDDQVGQRPGRSSVRLEVEARSGGQRIIHNYGHGGCGVTLSWGCAKEVTRLAEESL